MGRAEQTMAFCLLGGKLMLRYGAETYRVEDTMYRMAKAAGMRNINSFVTLTGIFLAYRTVEGQDFMQMIRVHERYQDLSKVTSVNQVSREFSHGELTIEEATNQLTAIEKAPMNYPLWLIYLASGIGGAAFSYLIGKSFPDILPAFIGGLITTVTLVLYQKYLKVKFFSEFLAAVSGGITAVIMSQTGLALNIDQVIIGTLIPLVPGVPLTNSVRDLMSGDLVAGVARGAEAGVTSLSIAAGVVVSLSFLYI
ncbi:threonine/serine exporter [Salibacterium salarium]|uniref:Threonine/serine exporter n=1 Tax=Salibacterium salarium TaxID=284579 RepID=A0A428MS90_9BACI|nr:threonine/serine exporter family protein [Salibacterium salarium]RSL28960.1 threonine/serine exporter [Salibacterium salarium]